MRPIDADALLKQLAEVAQRANKNAAYTGNRSSELTWDMAVKYIKNAPTSEQKKGKWIVTGSFDGFLKCSCCKYMKPWNEDIFNFCPHCGADMREEKEE